MNRMKVVVEIDFVPGEDKRETARKFLTEGRMVAIKVESGGESFEGTGQIRRIEEEDSDGL